MGKTKFPPASTEALWNEVTTALAEPHYPVCGFTYDLSLTKFKGYGAGSGKAATDAGARTAFDYLSFILNGGQKLIGEKHDQLGLPEGSGDVLKIAKEGLEKISYE
jgi:hypothetical protein